MTICYFLDNYKTAISTMEVSKLAYLCCLAPMQHFVEQLHSITIIFEDNRVGGFQSLIICYCKRLVH